MERTKTAIIIGAGPAGLTAAYELLTRTSDIKPVIFERDPHYVGGISRTVSYDGNRIDIGGHRFFSKSDKVMRWWADMLPVAAAATGENISYQGAMREIIGDLRHAAPDAGDRVMLLRPRLSRIIYGGEFYPYPIELSLSTLKKLGVIKVSKIIYTYAWALLFPRRPEKTLEDFFVNRFGTELYLTFFKSYTEKVWGVPCTELSAEWGAQRIKGVSITKAVAHAAKKLLGVRGKTETSLIEQFLYPSKGPGFMWEVVAEKVRALGGEVRMGTEVVAVQGGAGRVTSVEVMHQNGAAEILPCDYLFSTTDIRYLVQAMGPTVPAEVKQVAVGLQYRDFLTVGLVLDKVPTDRAGSPLRDTWIYVHEPNVHVGRIQFFHNWSPYLVQNSAHGHVGLEYFCNEGDSLWNKSESELRALAEAELKSLGLMRGARVLKGVVVRQPKAYPGYFGSYEHLPIVRDFFDSIENMFLIGRNGMHRYNNQDHSMLTAMVAVDAVLGKVDKREIWQVNAEDSYHEDKR